MNKPFSGSSNAFRTEEKFVSNTYGCLHMGDRIDRSFP